MAKKVKMSQIWKDDKVIPVTVLQAGPVTVTQVKTKEKDGYEAVQVGFGKAKRLNKPQAGHLQKIKNNKENIKDDLLRHLKEFRIDRETDANQDAKAGETIKIGDLMDVSQFNEGDYVKISGITKGRGFQGVVKRHGFHGGPKTHGQKNRHRAPGSIGATAPQRIMPGRKMAGHMGTTRTTVKNLKIVAIDKEKNILMIKGAVPGNRGALLEISN